MAESTKVYDEIKAKILPFDLIAFRGDDFISDTISNLEYQRLGNGEFSHVGLVITSDILSQTDNVILEPGRLYVLESNITYGKTGGLADITGGKDPNGVQIRDLEELIQCYIVSDKNKIAWCKIINNPFDSRYCDTENSLLERRNNLKIQFERFYVDHQHILYSMSPVTLLSSIYPIFRPLRWLRDTIWSIINSIYSKNKIANTPNEWRFCSELVANVYQLIGILPPQFNAKNVVPVDFFGFDEDGIDSIVETPIYFRTH